MKLAVLLSYCLFGFASVALADIVFIVGPRPGVTTRELSQRDVSDLARAAADAYSLKISRADAEYRRKLENAGFDPTLEPTEQVDPVVVSASAKRAQDYRLAIPASAREVLSMCRRLCYVHVDGRTFQEPRSHSKNKF